MSDTTCSMCGWDTGGAYHPYIACLIYNATGTDPLPYLETVVADAARYGGLPRQRADWPPLTTRRKRIV